MVEGFLNWGLVEVQLAVFEEMVGSLKNLQMLDG